MTTHLQAMTGRYRIGDGTGGTFVGPSNNCSQDSNQALFASLRQMGDSIQTQEATLQQWASQNPDQAERLKRLVALDTSLQNGACSPLANPAPTGNATNLTWAIPWKIGPCVIC
jgi:predicted Abi (CAAX) family protease